MDEMSQDSPSTDLETRLRAGDPDAFRDLVEAYKKKFYGLAFQMTRNHMDAEDVSQAAFMRVFKALGTIKPGGSLNAWLYRVVYNAAIDHIRKRPFFPEAFAVPGAGEIGPDSADPARRAEATLMKAKIDAALASVSERERAAFMLRHDHGLDLKEIAEVMGVSLGAVKSYLFRSLHKLQTALADGGPGWDKETDHV
jgi:RNA polymerase sigma-70 factor (ECF subfamily)